MKRLELDVHNCTKCRRDPNIAGYIQYYPVYSFGELDQKPIWVVGINPSHVEYKGKNQGKPYLSDSPKIKERRHSQLSYFDNEPYDFFLQIEKFFHGEVRDIVVEWKTKPWEKVGFVDLVKCVTKRDGGQFSKASEDEKQNLIKNCELYLKEQLITNRPKLLVAYGEPVCAWFGHCLGWSPKLYESALLQITQGTQRSGYCPAVCFLHQPSPPGHKWTNEEIKCIRCSIIGAFKLLGCDRF